MPAYKFWIQALEVKHKEAALTLVPKLLNAHGMEWTAAEAGVSMGHLSRWCRDNGIERTVTYQRRDKQAEPS